ncbi:MAG: hypothetical protein ABIR57_00690 [Aeromicrobium sp.]
MRWIMWGVTAFLFVFGGVRVLLGGDYTDGAGLIESGAILLAVSVIIELTYRSRAQKRHRSKALFSSGTTADALVESVDLTGSGDRFGSLRVILHLLVKPVGAPEFRIRTSVWIQHNSVPRTGDTVPVAYDPAHPDDLVLGDLGTAFQGAQVLKVNRGTGPSTDQVPDAPRGWAIGVGRMEFIGIGIAAVAFWVPFSPGTTRDDGLTHDAFLFGAVWLGISLWLIFKARLRMLRARRETALFRTGIRGEGVISAVSINSHKTVNTVNIPVTFTLHVTVPGIAPFDKQYSLLVASRSLPINGDLIDVAVDPADPSRVALRIDWSTNTRGGDSLILRHDPPPPDAGRASVSDLARLQALLDQGVLTETEFNTERLRAEGGS